MLIVLSRQMRKLFDSIHTIQQTERVTSQVIDSVQQLNKKPPHPQSSARMARYTIVNDDDEDECVMPCLPSVPKQLAQQPAQQPQPIEQPQPNSNRKAEPRLSFDPDCDKAVQVNIVPLDGVDQPNERLTNCCDCHARSCNTCNNFQIGCLPKCCLVDTNACITSFDLASITNQISGILFALGLALVLDCWLLFAPTISENCFACTSMFAAMLLNTVDLNTLRDDRLRTSAYLLFGACYIGMFTYFAWVMWGFAEWSKEMNGLPDCTFRCCTVQNGYHSLCIVAAASLMRFAPALLHLWGSAEGSGGFSEFNGFSTFGRSSGRPSVSRCSLSPGLSVGLLIFTAFSLVAACMLQLFASFSSFGTEKALMIPLSYAVILPISFCVRMHVVMGNSTSQVWRAWSQVISPFVYLISIMWPFLLFHRNYLDKIQAWLAFASTCCVLISVQLIQFVIEANAK